MIYKGIDVSKYQGDIKFNELKDIDFAIIRIGYGMYENQKDPKFEANYQGFTNKNIKVGIYHYSYAKNPNEALKEAELVLKWLNQRKIDLPVYIDIEDKSQISLGKQTLTSICQTFCEKIKQNGYDAGIYSYKYFLTNYLDQNKLSNYSIWVAQYNKENTYTGKYDMWQYTSKGKVAGINGNVDLNLLYNELQAKNELPDLNFYRGVSIVDALKEAGYDSSFESRKNLYERLGYKDTYQGTSTQNLNILNKLKGSKTYQGTSIIDALKSINIDSSFQNRKKIALKNGIRNYKGTSIQNTKLLKLFKSGNLKI